MFSEIPVPTLPDHAVNQTLFDLPLCANMRLTGAAG
jgi:hypothetical protein